MSDIRVKKVGIIYYMSSSKSKEEASENAHTQSIFSNSETWKYALVQSLPVFFGYLFLGIAFGILLEQAGFRAGWALLSSLVIYAGSGQFLLVSLLRDNASLAAVSAITLLINGRHIFYGLSFVEKFRAMGRKGLYMIFSLTDETYSVLCSIHPPAAVDPKKAMFRIALLDHSYWILGSLTGALMGQLIPFDFEGVDFSMTALFVVIFLDQWKSMPSHIPAVVGIFSSVFFLLLLGPDRFLLPSLAAAAIILFLCKRWIVPKLEGGGEG